jgi:lipoprotein-anchoring transpeptidase ErfK/SrfK
MSRTLLGLAGFAAAAVLSAAPAAAFPLGSPAGSTPTYYTASQPGPAAAAAQPYDGSYYYSPHNAVQVQASYASQNGYGPAATYYGPQGTHGPAASYYGPQGTYGSTTTYSAYGNDPLFGVQGSPSPEETYRPQATAVPRQIVQYSGRHAPGTIVVSTEERRLYYVLGNGQAIQYGVGVGRPGFSWSGTQTVTRKREWPDWRPPAEMLARRPDLPRHMAGGPDNPLGARAMYLGNTLYRIHGSNEPETIGQAVSSGCIRMTNEDVVDLYSRVKVGTKVVVL